MSIIVLADVHDEIVYNPTLIAFMISRAIGRPITRTKEFVAGRAYPRRWADWRSVMRDQACDPG